MQDRVIEIKNITLLKRKAVAEGKLVSFELFLV